MAAIKTWVLQVYAALAVVPFLTFIVIWFAAYLFFGDKKRPTRLAVDVTTFLLLGSVYKMSAGILSSTLVFWLAILVLLLAAGWIGSEQNKKRGKISVTKIFRVVWRFAFLVFSGLYLLFFLLGVIRYITMA
jgi:hypothetical protein